MINDNTTATIYNLLLSVSSAGDLELKDRVLEALNDCTLLEKTEKELLKEFEVLCSEVKGVPTPGTLVARNMQYGDTAVIQKDSLMDYVMIFLKNKKNIKMHSIIHKGLDEYVSGKIDFETFGDKVQSALVIGTPEREKEEIESNLDIDFYEKLTEPSLKEEGIRFGIPCIDERFRGLQSGDIFTIAGFTGSMKTTLASNLVYNAAVKGKNTLYLSLEVSKEEMTYAFLSRHSITSKLDPVTRRKMPDYAIENKDNYMALAKDFLELPGKIRIVDERDIGIYSYTNFNNILEKINEEMKEKTGRGVDIIVLDHVQILKYGVADKSLDPYQVLNYFASYFREKAAREGYAVILVAQTSRDGYAYAVKNGGRYLESGIAESNEIERSSTGIVTIFTTDSSINSNEVTVQLIKNRFGEKMQDPEQAPLLANYFMIGNGVTTGSEDTGPVFTNNQNNKEVNDIDLEALLNGSQEENLWK